MRWARRSFRGGVAAVMVAVTLTTAATTSGAPAAAETLTGLVATSISSAGGGVCAATEDAEVYCWGPDWDGFIGNGTGGGYSFESGFATSPTRATTSGVEVGMGCSRTSAGVVECWGFDGKVDGGGGSELSDPPWGANTPRD